MDILNSLKNESVFENIVLFIPVILKVLFWTSSGGNSFSELDIICLRIIRILWGRQESKITTCSWRT
jgi:hypothetical protein